MMTSIAILIFSTALFVFYVQTLCENVLRREFSRAYFQDVLNALDLEFPRLQQAVTGGAPMSYSQIRLALKCDYFTLRYLIKNGRTEQHHFSWHERLVIGYFRLLLMMLPVRYVFHFQERQAVVKLTVILRYFANLVGERLTLAGAAAGAPSRQS